MAYEGQTGHLQARLLNAYGEVMQVNEWKGGFLPTPLPPSTSIDEGCSMVVGRLLVEGCSIIGWLVGR